MESLRNKRYPNMSDEDYKKWRENLSKAHKGKSTGPCSKLTKEKISIKNSGEGNGRWKGGIRIVTRGYIKIYSPDHSNRDASGYVLEHRLVVEKFIGRYLTKEEEVHHLDENKTNNNIENLMLFKNHSEHMKFHQKIKQFGLTNPIKRQIRDRWKEFI